MLDDLTTINVLFDIRQQATSMIASHIGDRNATRHTRQLIYLRAVSQYYQLTFSLFLMVLLYQDMLVRLRRDLCLVSDREQLLRLPKRP